MKLAFSISGDFITDQARQFWLESEFSKAYDLLGCLIGTTKEQHDEVLQGRMKFIGVNELQLVEDSWIPPEGYPSFKEVLNRASRFHELRRFQESEAEEVLRRAVKISTSYLVNEEEEAEAKFLIEYAERLVGKESSDSIIERIRTENEGHFMRRKMRISAREAEDREAEDFLAGAAKRAQETLMRMAMKKEGFDPSALPSTEAMLNRGTKIKPTLCPDMSSANGWLLPDGKYYNCGTMEHVGLAGNILGDSIPADKDPETHAESLGWIKLAKSFTGFHCIGFKKPTKKQLTKLWDYAKFHNRDYEELIQHLLN